MADNTPMPWEQDISRPAPAQPTPPWETAPPTPVNTAPFDALVKNAPGVAAAKSPLDAFYAGLHASASGLALSGGKSSVDDIKTQGFMQSLAKTVGVGLGDLPFNVVGGIAGAAAGAESGPGAVVTGGAGAMALPQAVRETMIDYYRDAHAGHPMTWQEVAKQIAASAWNVSKAAAEGAVGGKLGSVAGGAVERLGGSAFASTVANVMGFTTGAAGAQAALDGHAPDAQDFVTGSIVGLATAGIVHAAAGRVNDSTGKFDPTDAGSRVADNLHEIYRRTGTPPWEVNRLAKVDPTVQDETLAQDVNGKPVTPKLNSLRAPEPEPFKGEAETPEGGTKSTEAHVEELLPMVRSLEKSADDAISPKGAIGRYQILPGTARQYGFNPELLKDPAFNEIVARHVLSDLSKRFNGDTEAVLVAYNAGPGRAYRFIRDGRDVSELPAETQNYLIRSGLEGQGGGKPPAPPEEPGLPAEAEPPEGEKGKPNWNADTAMADYESQLGEDAQTQRIGSFMKNFVSELETARKIDKRMESLGILDPKKDVTTEEMFRSTYASDDRAKYTFFKGNFDPITFEDRGYYLENYGKNGEEPTNPSMLDVLKDVKDSGGNMAEFNLYRIALRTVQKWKKGIDVGIFQGSDEKKLTEARAVIQDPRYQKYQKINEKMQAYKLGTLKYGQDSGLFSQDSVNSMAAENLSHISLRRVMGDDAPFDVGQGRGKNFKATNPLKAMEGSDRQIVDPLLADMDNVRAIIRMSDRNRAIGHIVGSQKLRDAYGLVEVKPPKATLAAPGEPFLPYSMEPQESAPFEPFMSERAFWQKNSKTIVFYDKGKARFFEAKDPDVAQLMRGADSMGETTILDKAMQLPAKMERLGIVGAPDFGLRVGLTHQLTAWVLDPTSPPPFITMLRGMMDTWGKGDDYWKLMKVGGLPGAVTDVDMASAVQRSLDDQHALQATGALDKGWNVFQHPLEMARAVTEFITKSERLGYYKRATNDLGIDPLKAAMGSRKAYLDFSERATSSFVNHWAKWVPFFKPVMLTLKQGRDAIVDDPAKFATKAFLGLVVPQVALYALNRGMDQYLPEKDRYTSLPRWQREQYFITPPLGMNSSAIPEWARGMTVNTPQGVRMKLRRPFLIGPMIGTTVEASLDAIFQKDPHAFDDFINNFFEDSVPNLIPSAVRPVLEQETNYNFFKGRPLISDSLKEYTADEQYQENTSEAAKKLSAALGGHRGLGVTEVSPVVIDNYIQEWSGTLGQVASNILSYTMKDNNQPFDWKDLPFVKGFVVQNPRMGTQQVDDFYTEASKWEQGHRDIMKEVKAGDIGQAFADATTYDRGTATMITKVEHALNAQRQALQAINKNEKHMTQDEQRQLSNRIYQDAWMIAGYATKLLRKEPTDPSEAGSISDQATQNLNSAGVQQ